MLMRHGDVLIQEIEELPGGLSPVGGVILAHGEVTGHTHRIEDPSRAVLYRKGENLILKVLAPTRVVHEEHAAIDLAPGIYRVWQQREYLPKGQRWHEGVSFRAVRD